MNRYVEDVKQLVLEALGRQPAKIVLFGSRARGDASPRSDVDVGILPSGRLHPRTLGEVQEKLDNSNIPYQVDLVNLLEAGPEFQREALKDAIVWKDFA